LKGRILDLQCGEDGNVITHLETLMWMTEEHAMMGRKIDDQELSELGLQRSDAD